MVLQCTVHLSAANLLCQSTGDNSDAIGGQLSPLTSGSGVKWESQPVISAHWSVSPHVDAWFNFSGQNPYFPTVVILAGMEIIFF